MVILLSIWTAGCISIGIWGKYENGIVFKDDFEQGILESNKWCPTREGDFRESIVDVHDVDPTELFDYRLRLKADTIETRDDTVKFHGVRSIRRIDFSKGKRISFDLDWNNQSNGCYLTGAVYLCPTATNGNPRGEKDWLKFEYVGVPPGYNVRTVIATKIDGIVKPFDLDGWPENRKGRQISNQRITIILDSKGFKVVENGKEIYNSQSHNLRFTAAYLYLQMSSHSNYPSREIYFDNVVVYQAY
ncbi:MAG: hypothetical protein QME07_04425 [bacterium]|nr:hypothetical protein [bacterium]